MRLLRLICISVIFAHIFCCKTMSAQLLASRRATAAKPTKPKVPPPNKPEYALFKLPHPQKLFLPPYFLLPPNGQIEIGHITTNHVYAWNHRFEKELPAGLAPEPNNEQLNLVHECAYWLKQEALKHIRKRLKTRMLELTRKNYGESVSNITSYTQLTAFLQSEVEVGNGEMAFHILYGKESWPPAWEMAFSELFCKEMNIRTRGEFVNATGKRQYKAAIARLCVYELGQLRARVKTIVRRQTQAIGENGKKIKRRDKYNVPFDPTKHVKQSAESTATVKNNIMVKQIAALRCVRAHFNQHFCEGKILLTSAEAEAVIKKAENDLFSSTGGVNNDLVSYIDLNKTVEELAAEVQPHSVGQIDNTFYEYDNNCAKSSFDFDFDDDSLDGDQTQKEPTNNQKKTSDVSDSVATAVSVAAETVDLLNKKAAAGEDDKTPSQQENRQSRNTVTTVTQTDTSSSATHASSIDSDSNSYTNSTRSDKTATSVENSKNNGVSANQNILSVECPDGKAGQLPKKRKIIFPESEDSASDSETNETGDANDNNEHQHRTRPENKTKCVCKDGCKTVVCTDNASYCEHPNRLFKAICHGDCKKVINKSLMRSVGSVHYCNNVGVLRNKTPVCTFVICQACHVKRYESETKGGRRTRRNKQ